MRIALRADFFFTPLRCRFVANCELTPRATFALPNHEEPSVTQILSIAPTAAPNCLDAEIV